MKKACFLIILGLFTSIFVFAQFTEGGIASSDFVTGVRPVTIPIFNPESDRFFGAEFQNAFIRGNSRTFTFLSHAMDKFQITDNLIVHENRNRSDAVFRGAFALGGMFPIGRYLSVMGGIGLVVDDVYIAKSDNHFIGAGVFGYYPQWGIGLGVLGGYYKETYQELILGDDGFYYGTRSEQPEEITKSARFMIVPRFFLSDKIFFLNEFSANLGFSGQDDGFNFLTRLAFSAIQVGATKLGIDVYYNQYKYNMFLDQRLLGIKFDSKYLSIDIGHRQFLNTTNNPFAANYEDGMFGKIIAKVWVGGINNTLKNPLLFSYGFEQTFGLRHFFGFGIQFGSGRMTYDTLMETNRNGDIRWNGVMPRM